MEEGRLQGLGLGELYSMDFSPGAWGQERNW